MINIKLVILAAGQGTRLRPYTNKVPKCMVVFKGKPIINHIIETTGKLDFEKTCIITGYKEKILQDYIKLTYPEKNIVYYNNHDYDKTNMVSTLFCAESFLEGDIIISYSDIIYDEEVIKRLYESAGDICVVVDKNWKSLWYHRMEDPLKDAETMIFDNEGFIKELGKKTSSYKDVQGQYIGLIKISGRIIKRVKEFYHNLDKTILYDGKDYQNMYMTSFLQCLIDKGFKLKPLFIQGGWLEIDTTEDLERLKDYDITMRRLL